MLARKKFRISPPETMHAWSKTHSWTGPLQSEAGKSLTFCALLLPLQVSGMGLADSDLSHIIENNESPAGGMDAAHFSDVPRTVLDGVHLP